MSARVWNLVQSQWPRELRRREWSFFHVLLLIPLMAALVGPWLSIDPLASLIRSEAGGTFFASVLAIQALVLAHLASFLPADGKNDRPNGLHDLLKVAGCTAKEWLASRVFLMLPVFVTSWLLAMPFIALATTLGGLGWIQVGKAELILVATFLAVVAIDLRFSADSRPGPIDGTLYFLIILSLYFTPAELIAFLGRFSIPVSTSLESCLLFLWSCAPFPAAVAVIENRESAAQLAIACALPLVIAAYLVRSSCRILLAAPNDAPEAEASGLRESERVAPQEVLLTRSPDEPFAWQIWLLTSARKPIILWKGLAYAAATGLLLLDQLTGWLIPGDGSVIVFSSLVGLSLLFGVGIPAEAFRRENREETLPLLLLTPRSGGEIYDGWARGARWLMIPELVLAVVGLVAVVVLRSVETLAVAVSAIAGIMSLGPLAALCVLLRGTFECVALLVVVLVSISLIIFVGVLAVDAFGVAVLPATQIPLFVGLNRLCRGALSAHLEEKVQSSESN